jgi:hypothetical protein
MPTVLRLDDIKPDGVRVVIHWNKLDVGMSMFIPCINTTRAKTELNRIAKEKGMQLQMTPRIEGGKWGVRVWRVV